MTATTETRGKAQSAASTAADEGKRVGQVTGEEVKNVAGEAAAQVRNLADEARAQVEEQSRSQRDRLVSTLSTFGDDLDSMSREGAGTSGLAADVVRTVSNGARQLSSTIEGREPQELLGEVRSFARRRPGTFLLGSLAVGVLAGRLLRGAKDSGNTSGMQQGTGAGPAYDPLQADVAAPSTITVVDEPIAPAGVTTAGGAGMGSGLADDEPGVHRGTP
jgi:hypothetical protein